jgi:TPR repeat protein
VPDDPEIEELRLRADHDDLDALNQLACHYSEQGDDDAAHELWRRAAKCGDTKSMHNFAFSCFWRDELDVAELWFRKLVDEGHSDAVCGLGRVLLAKGDASEAESVFLRGLADDPECRDWLGVVEFDRGNREAARSWWQPAAHDGDPLAMSLLGSMLYEDGRLEDAEPWLRAAVESGTTDPVAMNCLGLLLKRRGDLDGAAHWFRFAAQQGHSGAMWNLGLLLDDQVEIVEAEAWFRRAFEGGEKFAMVDIGVVRMDRGDFEEARYWLNQAEEAGFEKGSKNLELLAQVIETHAKISRVSFTTFGWESVRCRPWHRVWGGRHAQLTAGCSDFPPDLSTWNVDEIRQQMLDLQGYVESRLLDLDAGDPFGLIEELMASEGVEQTTLLEIECFEIDGVKALSSLSRVRKRGEVHYGALLMLLFAPCFWTFLVDLEELAPVGAREGAVVRALLDGDDLAEVPEVDFDPYERRWDGLLPIEADPLSRLRILARELRDSITISEEAKRLAPFSPSDD